MVNMKRGDIDRVLEWAKRNKIDVRYGGAYPAGMGKDLEVRYYFTMLGHEIMIEHDVVTGDLTDARFQDGMGSRVMESWYKMCSRNLLAVLNMYIKGNWEKAD